MKIFFTCSTTTLLNNYKNLQLIIASLKRDGHVLTDDWMSEAYKNFNESNTGKDSDLIYDRKLKAISGSDIVIVEGSDKSFTVGHQLTIALSKSIPVLFLYKRLAENKNTTYVEGIQSNWIFKKSYESYKSAIKEIKSFIKIYENRSKKYRFQLVLTPHENYFLEEKMKATRKTKTDLIRELIKLDMKE